MQRKYHNVCELVDQVTEPDGKEQSWEKRNGSYLEGIKEASVEAVMLSCADKTNVAKFEVLDEVFRGR